MPKVVWLFYEVWNSITFGKTLDMWLKRNKIGFCNGIFIRKDFTNYIYLSFLKLSVVYVYCFTWQIIEIHQRECIKKECIKYIGSLRKRNTKIARLNSTLPKFNAKETGLKVFTTMVWYVDRICTGSKWIYLKFSFLISHSFTHPSIWFLVWILFLFVCVCAPVSFVMKATYLLPPK